jgi:catechol 2,3-dioxygenase-like lactoylglutathione lyase family enzyme
VINVCGNFVSAAAPLEITMYDHLTLKVRNLQQSLQFYQRTLEPLGHVVASSDATSAGLGPEAAPSFWLLAQPSEPTRGIHIAFKAHNRAAVDAFYRAGLAAGGRDNGAPGLRPDYTPTYYAAFLFDPDGNNVEAVHS